MMRIGIDVGGTNTDAVVVSGDDVIAFSKRPTSADLMQGIIAVLDDVVTSDGVDRSRLEAVIISTTHFTNAVVEVSDSLTRVGVVRIGLPAGQGVAPFADWPGNLRAVVEGPVRFVHGGFEYDGRPIAPFSADEVVCAAQNFRDMGVAAVAVSSVFSPMHPAQEQEAARIMAEVMGNIPVTMSHDMGGIGLLERENGAILNASLASMSGRISAAFLDAMQEIGLNVPLFLSQNDGTVMSLVEAKKFPVHTFASGPSNSLRGAAFLTGQRNCVVIDIGGTTADFGVVKNGFPRQSAVHAALGGVRTNLRFPDIFSLGLGGGSIVRCDDHAVTVGPDSVGYRLSDHAVIFGGKVLTATDIAVSAGRIVLGETVGLEQRVSESCCASAVTVIDAMLADGLDRVKSHASSPTVVIVGGANILVGEVLSGAQQVIVPDLAPVANAIGAAIGKIGTTVDYVFQAQNRDAEIAAAQEKARDAVMRAGARAETVEIVVIEEIQLSYIDDQTRRIIVRAVGDLSFDGKFDGEEE